MNEYSLIPKVNFYVWENVKSKYIEGENVE